MKSRIICLLAIIILPSAVIAQPGWTQKLDGWLDGVYQPLLFAGGNFYSKVSFADIDGDSDYDMFIGGGNTSSFKLLENIGTPSGPIFRLKELVVPGLFGAYGGSTDADFADLDGDNDLDAIVQIDFGRLAGRYVNSGNINNPIWSLPPNSQQIAIGGSGSPSLIDVDNDGDFDLINGVSDSTIYLFLDTSQSTVPYFQQTANHLGHINIGRTFNLDVEDIDNDGDYDIIACVTGGVNKRYENIGGPGNFQFILADSNFLGGQYTPDWLECPELVDIDADGDLDLFLAGAYGKLNYFENIGSPSIPEFIHRYDTTYFYIFPLNVSGASLVDIDGDGDLDIAGSRKLFRNIGPFQDPAWQSDSEIFPSVLQKEFCDIDGDGDQDLLFPASYLGVMLYENIGTPQIPQWDSIGWLLRDDNTRDIASMAVGDLDADGDYDILMNGSITQDLIYYENTGNAGNPQFTYRSSNYAGFHHNQTYPGEPFYPALGDIDNDGDLDILIAYDCSDWSRPKLFFYKNIGTPQLAVWDSVTDDYMGWFSSGEMYFSYVHFGDYDLDGDQDILLSYWQGLRLMLNQSIVGIDEDTMPQTVSVSEQSAMASTYPNPSNAEVVFDLSGFDPSQLTIDIFNILGQKIESIESLGSGRQIKWRANCTPSGLYFYRVLNGDRCVSGKFVLLK